MHSTEYTAVLGEWLPWLNRVRFLVITLLVMVVVAVSQFTPIQIPVRTLVPLVVLWYALALGYLMIQRWLPQARWQAPLQLCLDLVIITGVVYATGSQDSDFISLICWPSLWAAFSSPDWARSWSPDGALHFLLRWWSFPTTA